MKRPNERLSVRNRALRGLLGPALVSLPVASCVLPSYTLDPSLDLPLDASVSKCGAFAFADQDCHACIERSCCAEAAACKGDASCAAFYDCLFQCAIPGAVSAGAEPSAADVCVSACFDKHRAGIDFAKYPYGVSPQEIALAECRGVNCAACGEGRGMFDGYRPACAACVRTRGAPDLASCATEPECVAFYYCRSRCLNPWCTDLCPVTPPTIAGAPWAAAYDRCASDCQGRNWGCAGAYTVPRPEESQAVLTLHLVDSVSDKVAPGVNVSACRRDDSTCTAPIAASVSDANGDVVLSVPTGATGFDGLLVASGAHVAPMLFSWSWPIFHDLTRSNFSVVPPEGAALFTSAVAGPTIDAARGHIAFDMSDCNQNSGVGLRITLSADGKIYYFEKGWPSSTRSSTTADGMAVALNVVPGDVTATFIDEQTGNVVASFAITVKAATWSLVEVVPSATSSTPSVAAP